MPKKYRLPKKRGHKGLKIFAILMTIFVVFPIAFVFAAFFDTTTKKVSDSEAHYQNIVSESLYKGIDKLTSEGQLEFKIDENMIDGIMVSACDLINQKQFVPKLYCYINGSNYSFVVDLQASFFKTRVLLNTSLIKDESNDTLIFQINNITIGRLPIPITWITGIASNFISNDMINGIFEQTGFHFKCDLARARLTYSREQFKLDVGAYVSKLGLDNPFLNVMLSMFGDDEVLKTSYTNAISATFDLTKLSLPKSPYKKEPPFEFDSSELEKHKTAIYTWMNETDDNKKQVLKEGDVAATFNYLMRGYDEGSDIIPTFISDISEKTLGSRIKDYLQVSDLKTYKGCKVTFRNNAETTFQDYWGEMDCKIDLDHLPNTVSFVMGTEEYNTEGSKYVGLNPYMAKAMSTAVGQTIPVTFFDGSKWRFEYVLIDNIYVGFEKDTTSEEDHKMVIYLRFNISNKFKITMTVATNEIKIEDNSEEKLGKIKFKLESINFGGIRFEDEQTIQMLLNLLPSGGEPFVFEDGKFCVDLDNIIKEEIPGYVISEIYAHKDDLKKEVDTVSDSLSLTFDLTE